MIRLTKVSSIKELTNIYKDIERYIDLSLTKAHEFTKDELVLRILKNSSQLWVAYDNTSPIGIAITNHAYFSTTSKLCIHLVGGENISKWIHTISSLEEYAVANELNEIEMHGRRGWLKLLPDYETDRVILHKRVSI
jgi:hypothetical protein